MDKKKIKFQKSQSIIQSRNSINNSVLYQQSRFQSLKQKNKLSLDASPQYRMITNSDYAPDDQVNL